jgi:hypothetical protein
MEGLKNDVICLDGSIKSFLPFEPVSYRNALLKAISSGEQNREKENGSGAVLNKVQE